ncbi:MAG TPA: HupE/UreJ family protein [Vicinamibacterales bacterium]|nr:HupE/UreJ family protein [Vicinamibacterales bacterium]
MRRLGNGERAKAAKKKLLSVLSGLCVLCAWGTSAEAHPVPFSYLDLRLQGNTLEGVLVAHIFDLGHDLHIEPAERLLDPAVASRQSQAIADMFARRLSIAADGRDLTPQWSEAEVVADRQSLRVRLRYRLESAPGILSVDASLFPYDPNHQTFLNVYERDALTQAILDRGRARFEYFAGTTQGAFAVVRRFVPAGVHHILIGPDHLLFLIGLLLLGGTVRQLAVIVTSFTIAHSITLSLAALNIVTPPARIIEPAIALSIVYVGADNLLMRGGRDVRAWIAFAFGFIHGFGFANVLREMDLPARALGWSLFSFNIGVEIGQLLVVVVVASALAALRSRSEVAGRQLAVAGSVVVMAAGAFWFIQRVFFPGGIS